MKDKQNNGTAMDALLECMDNNEEYQMKKQAVFDEHEAKEKTTTPATPENPRGARIIRGIFRPFLHIGAEILGVGVLGVTLMLAVAVVLFAAIFFAAWAGKMAGIQPNSPQELVLVMSACGTAIYALVVETRRFSKALRGWTDRIHHQIEGV